MRCARQRVRSHTPRFQPHTPIRRVFSLGADRIVKLVIGLQERLYRSRTTLHLALVNGEPDLCARREGEVIGVMAVECDRHHIQRVYGIVNPEKLADAKHVH